MVKYTQHAHRKSREMAGTDDLADLGRMAVNGMVTVGTVGIAANLMGGVLGSLPKYP